MIVAIEGPDRVGKTTVWEALRSCGEFADAHFVPNVSTDGTLLQAGDAVQLASERRVAAWWCALYVPRTLYVCDRCPFVSNLVYAAVYGRDPEPRRRILSAWMRDLRVVHLDTDERTLTSRGATPTEVSAAHVYRVVLRSVESGTVVDASKPPAEVVDAVAEFLREVGRGFR